MPTAIPRASRSPPPRWPHSPSNAARSMASGTTPSHPTSSRHEAVIPRQILSEQVGELRVREGRLLAERDDARAQLAAARDEMMALQRRLDEAQAKATETG